MTGTATRPPTTLGKRALHSRDADNDASLGEIAAMFEQAMDAGDADVVEMLGAIAHHAGG